MPGRRGVVVRARVGSAGSPHQAGVARIPALRQQGHLDVVLDDLLGLLLDLLDHRAGVRAERGRQDHLHLGQSGPRMICLIRASSTTFIPISGSTTERRASRIASSVARRSGSKAGASASVGVVALEWGRSLFRSWRSGSYRRVGCWHPPFAVRPRRSGRDGTPRSRTIPGGGTAPAARRPRPRRSRARPASRRLRRTRHIARDDRPRRCRRRDPEPAQLGVVLEEPGQVVPVAAQLEQLADRQPASRSRTARRSSRADRLLTHLIVIDSGALVDRLEHAGSACGRRRRSGRASGTAIACRPRRRPAPVGRGEDAPDRRPDALRQVDQVVHRDLAGDGDRGHVVGERARRPRVVAGEGLDDRRSRRRVAEEPAQRLS